MSDRITSAHLAKEAVADQGGFIRAAWFRWVSQVSDILGGRRPLQLQSKTVVGVPPAADWPGCMIYVSNEVGGAVPAFSDGTNWRRTTDRAIIS